MFLFRESLHQNGAGGEGVCNRERRSCGIGEKHRHQRAGTLQGDVLGRFRAAAVWPAEGAPNPDQSGLKARVDSQEMGLKGCVLCLNWVRVCVCVGG